MIQFPSNDHNLSDRSIAPKLENEVSESCMERIFQFEDDQLMGTFESFSSAAPGASGPLTESLDFFKQNFKNGALSLIRGKYIFGCIL